MGSYNLWGQTAYGDIQPMGTHNLWGQSTTYGDLPCISPMGTSRVWGHTKHSTYGDIVPIWTSHLWVHTPYGHIAPIAMNICIVKERETATFIIKVIILLLVPVIMMSTFSNFSRTYISLREWLFVYLKLCELFFQSPIL